MLHGCSQIVITSAFLRVICPKGKSLATLKSRIVQAGCPELFRQRYLQTHIEYPRDLEAAESQNSYFAWKNSSSHGEPNFLSTLEFPREDNSDRVIPLYAAFMAFVVFMVWHPKKIAEA
jgi:hypothetical protein